jgi:choice-of-anchor B domain-containing protein
MRLLVLLFALVASKAAISQNVNVVFQDSMRFPGKILSNIWGYSAAGKEYALVGRADGMTIVDVTTPTNIVFKQHIPGTNSSWREIKTYNNYAYIVSEAADSLIIVNLSSLPGTIPASGIKKYRGNGTILNQLRKAHALQVDETAGFLYLYGTNLCNGQALCFSLTDPWNPSYAGCIQQSSYYVHDGYADNDMLYAAHIGVGLVSIIDVSNKNSPDVLSEFPTPGAKSHNTWLSGSTLFTTDESNNSFLVAYDISDPGNPTEKDRIQSNPGSNSMVHNTYIKNNYAITSWYRDGFTIVDVARPANMVQVGNYDTYLGSGGNWDGAWGVFPYFSSGTIVVSNISNMNSNGTNNNTGELWVFSPTYQRGCYIEGWVRNTAGTAITGAFVELISTSTNQSSNAVGDYKMGRQQSGTFTLRVTKAGYQTYTQSITISNGTLTTVNVTMQSSSAPVELVQFDAKSEGKNAILTWETAAELNNKGFEIQHTRDLSTWETKGWEAATGSGSSYTFSVRDLAAGTHYFRLNQVDLDGKSSLSEAKRVEISGTTRSVEVLPTVIRESALLRIGSEREESIQVRIVDASGVQFGETLQMDIAAAADIPLDFSNAPSGMYFVEVAVGTERITRKVLKD